MTKALTSPSDVASLQTQHTAALQHMREGLILELNGQNQHLVSLVARGNLQAVKESVERLAPIKPLQKKASLKKRTQLVNQANELGYCPLHVACLMGFEDIVAFLLAQGADPLQRDGKGYTAFHEAVKVGNIDILEKLYQAMEPVKTVNVVGPFNRSLLHTAVFSKAESSTHWLCSRQVELNTQEEGTGKTALHVAAELGAVELIELLLHKQADATIATRSMLPETPLMSAIISNHTAAVNAFLKLGHTLTDEQQHRLRKYASQKNRGYIDDLLDKIGEPTASKQERMLSTELAGGEAKLISSTSFNLSSRELVQPGQLVATEQRLANTLPQAQLYSRQYQQNESRGQSAIPSKNAGEKADVAKASSIPSKAKAEKIATAFPIAAIKQLLDTVKELDNAVSLSGLVDNMQKGKQTKAFKLLNYFMRLDTKQPHVQLLASNLTLSSLYKFGAFSKNQVSLTKRLKKLFSQQPEEPVDGVDGVVASINALKAYFDSFKEAEELDYEALTLHLIQSREFRVFLQDEQHQTQLAEFIAAAKIPSFDQAAAKLCLQTLSGLCERLAHIVNDQLVTSYQDFMQSAMRFAANNPLPIITDIEQLFACMKQIEPVIRTYLKPMAQPLQELAEPICLELIKQASEIKPSRNKDARFWQFQGKSYCQLSHWFESYRTEELGPLLKSSLEDYINAKTLDQMKLSVPLTGLAFKQFSFKGTSFTNVSFANSYFENCDFTDAIFTETIDLSGVWLDYQSLQSLIPSLMVALEQQVLIQGQVLLYGEMPETQGNVSECLDIPLDLRPYLAEPIVVSWLSLVNQSRQTNYDNPMIEETVPGYDGQEFAAQPVYDAQGAALGTEMPSWANYIMGGLYNFLSMGLTAGLSNMQVAQENMKTQLLEYIDLALPKNSGEGSKEMKEALLQWREKLQADIGSVSQQLQRHESATQDKVDALTAKLSALESKLVEVTENSHGVQQHFNRKQVILAERESIMAASPQAKAYYQTLFSELAGALLSVYLLQNQLHLIQGQTGQVMAVANTMSYTQDGMLANLAKQQPTAFQKAWRTLNGMAQHSLAVFNQVKSALSVAKAIPQAGAVLGPVVEGIKMISGELVDKAEQTKLGELGKGFSGISPKTLEKMADAAARKLSLVYRQQIALLEPDNARCFANAAVTRIIAGLFHGHFTEDIDFALQVVRVLREVPAKAINSSLLGIEIPFTTKSLVTLKGKAFTEDKLYRRSGVSYFDNDTSICYSNDQGLLKEQPKTYASYIGYIEVTRVEFKQCFQERVILEQLSQAPTAAEAGSASAPAQPAKAQKMATRKRQTIVYQAASAPIDASAPEQEPYKRSSYRFFDSSLKPQEVMADQKSEYKTQQPTAELAPQL